MRVNTIGTGVPQIAVVGAVHGDEPCGAKAINRFLAENRDLQRPVKFIILNEPALDRDIRYTEADVNRMLPGDPESDIYEERLAYDFVREVAGCYGLGIHSTVSYDEPFGAISNPTNRKRELFASMRHVNEVMDTTPVSSGRRCVDLPWFVDIEAGEQGTDSAAEYAYECILDFLRFTGALPDDTERTETNFYEVFDLYYKEPDSAYRFLGNNFERVAESDVYATRDGTDIVAEQEFWPILMSDTGHDELFGYRSTLTGQVAGD